MVCGSVFASFPSNPVCVSWQMITINMNNTLFLQRAFPELQEDNKLKWKYNFVSELLNVQFRITSKTLQNENKHWNEIHLSNMASFLPARRLFTFDTDMTWWTRQTAKRHWCPLRRWIKGLFCAAEASITRENLSLWRQKSAPVFARPWNNKPHISHRCPLKIADQNSCNSHLCLLGEEGATC